MELQKNHYTEEKFAVVIRKHRFLGFLPVPCILTRNEDREFFAIKEQLRGQDVKKNKYPFSGSEKNIIEKSDQLSDNAIIKLFSKGKNINLFYQSLTEEFFKRHLQPYIERRIISVTDIIKENDIEVYLKEKDYQYLYENDRIEVLKAPAETVFNFIKEQNLTKYFLSVLHEGEEINLTHKKGIILSNSPCLLILQGKLFTFNDIDGKKLTPFFVKEHIEIPLSAEKKYFNTFILNAVKNFRVKASGFTISDIYPEKSPVLSFETDWKSEPVLYLLFRYGEKEIHVNNKNSVFVNCESKQNNNGTTEYEFTRLTRDKKWEQSLDSILTSVGLIKDGEGAYKPPLDKKLEKEEKHFLAAQWLNKHSEILSEKGFSVIQNFYQKKYFTQRISLNFSVKNRTDWFDIYAVVHFGNYEIPFIKLKNHIIGEKREYELPNGEIAILPEEWFSRYKELFLFSNDKEGHLQIKQHYYPLMQKIDGIPKELIQRFENLNDGTLDVDIPGELNATLRSYQKAGFSWLYKLQQNNFGGCLADDMGLGKTLQTLTLILKTTNEMKSGKTVSKSSAKTKQLSLFDDNSAIEEKKKENNTSLIVMPTSLIHNWQNEIEKFVPSLKIYKYVGNREKEFTGFDEADIVLTSYGIVRNDIEFLQQYEFLFLILDESHYVKNPLSKTYNAVNMLRAQYRFVLTGTPIENSLLDLWSQMNFVNEGLLGSLRFFKEEFLIPIEKQNDTVQQERLRALINPFLLRRKKSEVAKDLPPMTEQYRYCEMTEAQSKFYDTEKSKIRNEIMDIIGENTIQKSSILIIQGLTKLRQIANHPTLIDSDYSYESGKFYEITDTLENIIAENHKVLVFSSFVKHLELVEDYINEKKWQYSKLIGSTTNRDEQVKKFTKEDDNRIFLISLKAGGVGLNLTAADYVLIIDPWWNPAAELQAINRAHRIGQDKNVFVYRFITENTVEQKIKKLQERKSELADVFVNSNNPLQNIDIKHVMELFS